jgi:hypothetical protein
MMTALAIETMLIALVLGLRFNVLVLVPATVIGSAFAIAKGMAYSDNIWTILLVMASVMAALQIGYLAGAVFCFVIGDPGGEVFDLPSELLQLRSPSAGGAGPFGQRVQDCARQLQRWHHGSIAGMPLQGLSEAHPTSSTPPESCRISRRPRTAWRPPKMSAAYIV